MLDECQNGHKQVGEVAEEMSDRTYYEWDEKKKICYGYVRSGKCKNCGDCCNAHIVYRVAGEDSMQDRRNGGSAKTPGLGIWSEVNKEDDRIYFSTIKIEINTDKPCSLLGEDNLCKVHDEKKAMCAEWPFNPSDLEFFPNCGYSFEEAGEWTYEEIGEK